MNEREEGFVKVKVAHVSQRLCKETCVKQVHAGVFRAADIFVDGEHFIYFFLIEGHLIVLAVGIT